MKFTNKKNLAKHLKYLKKNNIKVSLSNKHSYENQYTLGPTAFANPIPTVTILRPVPPKDLVILVGDSNQDIFQKVYDKIIEVKNYKRNLKKYLATKHKKYLLKAIEEVYNENK